MATLREKRRVAYIISIPEWYGHNVNDMFFRLPHWLFVPVQDFTAQERVEEYKKSFYFFVSGYGNKEEAIQAYKLGCVLIGVRADVPTEIPVITCGQWDPSDVFITFLFVEFLRKTLPFVLKPNSRNFVLSTLISIFRILRPLFKVVYLIRTAIMVWKNQGFRNVMIKTRNYFHKVMHI